MLPTFVLLVSTQRSKV